MQYRNFPRVSKMRSQKWLALAGGLALGCTVSSKAAGQIGMDCPLAHQAYSSKTPLLDLMINPAAKAILTHDMGGMIEKLPPMLLSTDVPSFGAIITPNDLLELGGIKNDAMMAKLDADLAAVPLTREAIRGRCARYDETPPSLPKTIRRPALLVFEKINGFKDGPGFDAAHKALEAMATRRGWTMIFSDNGAVFNSRALGRFNAVIWNNISGDALTVPQQNALKAYIKKGGGFAGFHGSGGDPFYVWGWYADALLGERFAGHPMNPQFQDARVLIDDRHSTITKGLGDGWVMNEEWYSFKNNPRANGSHILATLDEKSYNPVGMGGQDLRMGDHPIAWTRCVGNGRSFYSAIGHRPENYSEPHSVSLLENGIAWAAGLGDTKCSNGKEVAR